MVARGIGGANVRLKGDSMTFIRTLFLAAILTMVFALHAYAVSFESIAGKWCGEVTNYTFSRDILVVDFADGSPPVKFKVISYEYSGGNVTMHWINKGQNTYTDFNEFSADGQTMVQNKTDVGPRRSFHRC